MWVAEGPKWATSNFIYFLVDFSFNTKTLNTDLDDPCPCLSFSFCSLSPDGPKNEKFQQTLVD